METLPPDLVAAPRGACYRHERRPSLKSLDPGLNRDAQRCLRNHDKGMPWAGVRPAHAPDDPARVL